jgi:carboxyl-terminal processing protease
MGNPAGVRRAFEELEQRRLQAAKLLREGVLFDRGTASSGEAVAISFAGRTRERSFGEHTAGFSTSNGTHELPDGGVLYLCNAIEADRSGKIYPDGLNPDVKLPAPGTRPSEEQ